jgi:hypothetical protein
MMDRAALASLARVLGSATVPVCFGGELPINCSDQAVMQAFVQTMNSGNRYRAKGSDIIDVREIRTVDASARELHCHGVVAFSNGISLPGDFILKQRSSGGLITGFEPDELRGGPPNADGNDK